MQLSRSILLLIPPPTKLYIRTKAAMEHQILRRRLFPENIALQTKEEEEYIPLTRANAAASKTPHTYVSRGSPANELLLTSSTMKSKAISRTPSRKSSYPSAVVNTSYYSECFADLQSPLKGTPWEEAVLWRYPVRNRKRSGQKSLEELQCIEFLELFG